jgi:putative PIN family toxin of toxin-antitoxin system
MLRVVIDTNVLVSGTVNATTPPGRLLTIAGERGFELIVSGEIIDEYRRVMTRPSVVALHKQSPEQIERLLVRLRTIATIVAPRSQTRVVTSDRDDDKFVHAAVEGGAEFIVSGDRHLLNVRSHQGIEIVTPATLISFLESQPD